MAYAKSTAKTCTLAVEKLNSDAVVIRSQAKTDELEYLLLPGDVFGGHDYAEWLTVARSTGRVSCTWLDV